MSIDYKQATLDVISTYVPDKKEDVADALERIWLESPTRGIPALATGDQEALGATGTPVSVLTEMGKAVGSNARKRVEEFLPLVRLLWDKKGREGRILAVHALGPMELTAPEIVVPAVHELAITCIAWEDCDQLAMRALEPIVRKKPDPWLHRIEPWLTDESKWVRRAGITVVARIPMKHPDYTARCLGLTECLLNDQDLDVKRAVSFAIRIPAAYNLEPVKEFLARHVPPEDPATTWVLCDTIRSMRPKLIPEFAPLLPRFEQWAASGGLGSKEHRSVQSAIECLRGAGPEE